MGRTIRTKEAERTSTPLLWRLQWTGPSVLREQRQHLDLDADPAQLARTRRKEPIADEALEECHRRACHHGRGDATDSANRPSSAIHCSNRRLAARSKRRTLGRSYLQLISVRMLSPLARRTSPTLGMCTTCSREETRCISIRCRSRE